MSKSAHKNSPPNARVRPAQIYFWIAIATITAICSASMLARYTWTSYVLLQPPVGGVLLAQPQARFEIPPSLGYASINKSNFVTLKLARPPASELVMLIADLTLEKPCAIAGGFLVGAPLLIDKAQYAPTTELGSRYTRPVYAIRFRADTKNPDHLISLTCDVNVAPGEDSYAMRSVIFVPPVPAHFGKALVPGFIPHWPQYVGFSVFGNVEISISGDAPRGAMPRFYDEREIGANDLSIHAKWTDTRRAAQRDFGLWLAAAIAGIGAAALVEVLRSLFDILVQRREDARQRKTT